ncbi:hybrid sensor histidine kinase/response regulator [Flaviaesturariibacter flavus]|uniref:histidine kinase n=1 Tax=Flaviaesturariibacter flavus TaxID=2502780 RepID=A0A4R1B431_9BACT|nr:response regulator [Flaviaesturariibacter flavus]TCJ12671.1 hybrid sensor histidine kinase/response regulator [Flaviaesturariibacter flavus]
MILIVDDKPENIFSLERILALNGFATDSAPSGEDALKKVLRQEYALIILDVQMPGMDGFEVAEAITSLNKTRDTPIIFLSAVNTHKRFVTKGFETGAVDYITKPVDPDILILKVRNFYRLYEKTQALKAAERELKLLNEGLERRVAERTRELLETNRELEISNHDLQQFASVASHDLKEPLRKIQLFGNMIKDADVLHGRPASHLEKIIGSAERMSNLIQDLLSVTRLSESVHFARADLATLVDEVLSDLELVIREKGATIDIGPLPQLYVIPGLIRQLFLNIIGNALKFSRPGVPPLIQVRAGFTETPDPEAPLAGSGAYCRIEISDNGIGFDEKYAGKIFTLFQRLHAREEYEGTGIGLAIVKKIVEKHKGLIFPRSTPGEGARFIIFLPATGGQQPVPPAAATFNDQTT